MNRALQFGLALILSAIPCGAQVVFNASAGSSTLYEASAAQLSVSTANFISSASIGDYNGHLIFGASEHMRFRGDDVFLGDRQISLTSGASGISVPLIGLDVERHTADRKRTIAVFVGKVGPDYWVPYGWGTQPRNFGAGYSFEQQFSNVRLSSLAILAGNQRTILEGANYRWKTRLNLIGTVGVLQNAPMWNGSANYVGHNWGANLARQTLILDGVRADVTSESLFTQVHLLDFQATAVQGRSGAIVSDGETFGAGLRLLAGALQLRTNYYMAGAATSLVNSATEQIRRKYSIIESLTTGEGHTTLDVGGAYTSNQFTASVNHVELYYPLLRNPWQRTLSVTVSFRIHDATATVGTLATPSGGVKFTAYGGSYFYGDGAASNGARTVGKFEIRGIVVDANAKPVGGAAIKLDGQMVYTDDEGRFSVHVGKNKPYPLAVVCDDFLLGDFHIVSVPASVTPGQEIKIVVAAN